MKHVFMEFEGSNGCVSVRCTTYALHTMVELQTSVYGINEHVTNKH